MIPVDLSKERADELIRCLRSGKPLTPPRGGWNGHESLAVAGMMLAAARAQGPGAWYPGKHDFAYMPGEHREHVADRFNNDLFAAVALYAELMTLAMSGAWDKHFEGRM